MIARKSNAAAPAIKLDTVITVEGALNCFKSHAILASEALVGMVSAGVVAIIVAYHLAAEPSKRPKLDSVLDNLERALKAANPTKGRSTLAAYMSVCRKLYLKLAGEKRDNFGGVIADIRDAKDAEAATQALVKYLSDKNSTTLDKVKVFAGVAPSNASAGTSTATPTAKVQNTLKAIGTAIKDNRADAGAMAKVIANALPEGIKPAVMAVESVKRVADATDCERIAFEACKHFADVDLLAFDAFVARMVTLRDTMMEAGKARDTKASETATPKTAGPRSRIAGPKPGKASRGKATEASAS